MRKKARRISYVFEKKRRTKNLPRAVPRQGIPFLLKGPRQEGGGSDLLFLWQDHNSETSSSTTRMHFALGTSSSSYITCVVNWSARTVHRGGDGLILQTKPWLEFRSGAGGRCAGTNESTGSVWLGRCSYIFAQGTCSNRQRSH
jgi:hypothetical protein